MLCDLSVFLAILAVKKSDNTVATAPGTITCQISKSILKVLLV